MTSYVLVEDARDAVFKAQEIYDKVSETHYQAWVKYNKAKKVYADVYDSPTWYNVLFIPTMKEECMISQENYRLTTEEFIKAQTNLKEAQKNYDNVSETLFGGIAYSVGAF
jgi:hypothetical protein